MKNDLILNILKHTLKGRKPYGLVVMGGNSCPEGRGFKSQQRIFQGKLLTNL